MSNFLDLKTENFSLDINQSSLKIVKIKTGKKSFSVASFNELKIKPGIIKDGIIQDEKSLTEAIKEVCKKAKGERIDTKYVIVSLPEGESFLQVIQMPKMSEDELRMAVALEAENYIPMPIDRAYFDFQVIAPIEDGLDHLDVLIVAMSQKIVNSYVSCIKKAGLIPIAIETESQAVARALIKRETSDYPVIIVDFSENEIDFIIFSGNSVRFTSLVPFATEELNLKADKNKNAKNSVIGELVSQIEKYTDFYKEHAAHEHIPDANKIKKIILCGQLQNLKGLADRISKIIGIETEIGDPFINFPEKSKGRNRLVNPLSFTVTLGSALRNIYSKNF